MKMVHIFNNNDLPVNNDKIKNLYYSIKNASECDPIQVLDNNLFPLSNLSLSVAKFDHLVMFINKDEPLKNLIKANFGEKNLVSRSLGKAEEYIENDVTVN